MKSVQTSEKPLNLIIDKDRSKGLYLVDFDYRQNDPRVAIGSTWIAEDSRFNRKFLMRVVDLGYHTDYDQDRIIKTVREQSKAQFKERDYDYYCRETAWMRLEGEIKNNSLQDVFDQPTVLRTSLRPTTPQDDLIIAAPDTTNGFPIGNLRSGGRDLEPIVTLEDRFVGFRTLICGTSGFGKSTLVRNIARYWLEQDKYGVIIDDLKGEYVFDIKNERGQAVPGLSNHPNAQKKLVLLTPFPRRYEGDARLNNVKIVSLEINIDDIPPESLSDVATNITPAQRSFLEFYSEKRNLFSLLLRNNSDGSTKVDDWYQHFKGFIIALKAARKEVVKDGYETDLNDFERSSYIPIFGVRKHLKGLEGMPFVKTDGPSCIPKIHKFLKSGATIILDKRGLSDSQKMVVSTVLANELYRHNAMYSAGTPDEQEANVIPFVYLVEEAHLMLSRQQASEGSVFVNFAKTGRSFQIGLIAVTQRPSSIDTNILSQFDNFVTFRLTNEQDVKDLLKAKSDFRGYEEEIRTMQRGMAVTAFGEPTKVQSIKGFSWTSERASTLLSEHEYQLLQSQHKYIETTYDTE